MFFGPLPAGNGTVVEMVGFPAAWRGNATAVKAAAATKINFK
jgi:hypothetical protein